MKSQSKHKEAMKLGQLRLGVLAAIAGIDPRGTDSRVTQAMCIVEAAFDAAIQGRKLIPRRVCVLGLAMAKSVEETIP
jgi:hypothetical protein